MGNVGFDPDRIEIIVESGGTLNIDEATLAGTGYPSNNCWYGIKFEPGSTGHILDSNIRDGIRGVDIQSEVEVSRNIIQHMHGVDGEALEAGPTPSGTAWGIYVKTPNATDTPLIMDNEIRNVFGGDGADGMVDGESSSGGAAYGIYVITGAPLISGNTIHIVWGGMGETEGWQRMAMMGLMRLARARTVLLAPQVQLVKMAALEESAQVYTLLIPKA